VGVNLGIQGESRVDFGTLASVVTYEAGSDDNHIKLVVPSMALGGSSKTLPLTVVHTGHGSATRNITLFQGVASQPDGTVTFQPAVFPEGTVSPNSQLVIKFPILVSALNMNTRFDITTSANLLFQPAQTMQSQALNDLNQVITSITLAKVEQEAGSATLSLRVQVPSLPQGVSQADANVSVTLSTADNPKFTPSSGIVPFKVGADAPPPGDFSVKVTGVQSPGKLNAATSTITLTKANAPQNGYLVVTTADLSNPELPLNESYTVTASSTGAGWTFGGDAGFTLQARGPQRVNLRITPGADPKDGTLTILIKSATHQSSVSYTLTSS
jgi:hypothetical protein